MQAPASLHWGSTDQPSKLIMPFELPPSEAPKPHHDEVLYIRSCKKGNCYYQFEWHVLDLMRNEIREVFTSMPSDAHDGSTAVASGNRVYVLGGVCCHPCPLDETCPDGKSSTHAVHNAFVFDLEKSKKEWTRASPMSVERNFPSCFAYSGNIYAFGGSPLQIAEVFDIGQNRWKLLPGQNFNDSPPALFDSSCSQILIHNTSDNCLYAYNMVKESWTCHDDNYGRWSHTSVIVDGVIYSISETREDLFCLAAKCFSLHAYDVAEKKWLPTKWLSEFEVFVGYSSGVGLFHLGNRKLCVAWYSSTEQACKYVKFEVYKKSEEIHAVGASVARVPFEFCHCWFMSLDVKVTIP